MTHNQKTTTNKMLEGRILVGLEKIEKARERKKEEK